MNLTVPLIAWIVGDLLGIGLNLYMVDLSFSRRRRLKLTPGERYVTVYDSVQWGFGLFVKLLGLLIALWAATLPPQAPLPLDADWHLRYGRAVITFGLLFMMLGMDVRDVILVYFNRRWWRATTGGK